MRLGGADDDPSGRARRPRLQDRCSLAASILVAHRWRALFEQEPPRGLRLIVVFVPYFVSVGAAARRCIWWTRSALLLLEPSRCQSGDHTSYGAGWPNNDAHESRSARRQFRAFTVCCR